MARISLFHDPLELVHSSAIPVVEHIAREESSSAIEWQLNEGQVSNIGE